MSIVESKHKKELTDFVGRSITYLRVSLTDQCNFRCGYCYDPCRDINNDQACLNSSELLNLITVFASMGIRKIRFTGGEPLLRKDIIDIIKETSANDAITQIGITTNGFLLNNCLDSLVNAGLNKLNVSLDTLNSETFRSITGIDAFDKVYSGIINAEKSDMFDRVKINTVIMRGINDNEIPALAEWALSRKIDLRFIEYMPTTELGKSNGLFVSEDEIRQRIGIDLIEINQYEKNNGPAVSYSYENYPGRIGFISAVSKCFCGDCNRLRLTSKGELTGCLFQESKIDLKAIHNNVNGNNEISDYIISAISNPNFRREPNGVSAKGKIPFMRGVGG